MGVPLLVLAFIYRIEATPLEATPLSEGDQSAKIELGRSTYLQHCARCHGPEGGGDGPDASRVPVAPRVLTGEDYKFKTTEYGTPPSDEDLQWVLDHGMSGAGMPSFSNLSRDAKEGLIAYIKSISSAWGDYPPEIVEAPNEKIKVNLGQGKEMFEMLQCALCHGNGGRANGTSAATLEVKPANLTKGWSYRAGNHPRDIYYRLMTGIAGSGMPSYKGALSNEQAWHLSHYVASLKMKTNVSGRILAMEVEKEVPSTFDDSLWNQAERTDVVLKGNYFESGKRVFHTVDMVSVKAIFNKEHIAVLLTWNDPTESDGPSPDSLLLAVKPEVLKSNVLDNLHSLYHENAADSLEVFRWNANRPAEVTSGNATLYHASKTKWRGETTLEATGTYEDGQWNLLFVKPFPSDLRTSEEGQKPVYIGLAVWDGGSHENDLNHPVSQWIHLAFKAPETHH